MRADYYLQTLQEIVQARRAAILAETGSSTLKRADFDVAGRDLLTSMSEFFFPALLSLEITLQ